MSKTTFIAVITLGFIGIASLTTVYMAIAYAAYVIMVHGFLLRKQRATHVRSMVAAISIDLILVAVLQVQRHAIQTAVAFTLSPMQQTHIAFSSVAVALYFPMIYLGVKNYKGKATDAQKLWHRRLGYATFLFRTLGFITMFSQLSHVKPG